MFAEKRLLGFIRVICSVFAIVAMPEGSSAADLPDGVQQGILTVEASVVFDDDDARAFIERHEGKLHLLLPSSATRLLQHLFSGNTTDTDEEAIIALIEELPPATVQALDFTLEDYDDEVDGDEWDTLKPILYAKLTGSPVQQGFTDNLASVVVRNETGKDIVSVQIAHKYSDDYKESLRWFDLKNGQTTSGPQTVRYRTGVGRTGKDWWFVAWNYVDDDQIHYTDPVNLRGVFDFVERAGNSIITTATHIAGIVCTVNSGGLCAPYALAASATVEGSVYALLNREGTKGFKQHILEDEDALQTTTIVLKADGTVRFQSNSGNSTTGYTSADTPELSAAERKKLRALAPQAVGSCPPELANWMERNHPAIKDRSLLQVTLPGSHDAGSYEKRHCRLASGCNTETQSLDIGGQLQCGARFFDIRPVKKDGVLNTGHYNINDTLGALGCLGGSMDDVLSDINTFLNEHPKEIIILNVQHPKDLDDKDFGESDWDNLKRKISRRLGGNLYRNQNFDVTSTTLDQILRSSGNVLVRYRRSTSGDADDRNRRKAEGDFRAGDFRLYDRYANTLDVEKMINDQTSKFVGTNTEPKDDDGNVIRFDPTRQQFVFSWTLTQNILTSATCSRRIGDYSIKAYADEANALLSTRYMLAFAHATVLMPIRGIGSNHSILLTDFIDGRSTVISLMANGLPTPSGYTFD